MKNNALKFINFVLSLAAATLIVGCAMGNTSIAKEDSTSISSKIIPGKTTQSEVRQLYGEPMYKQTASDGTETWTYSMMDTSFKTYVPFVPLVTGSDGTEGKDLSVKFNRAKIVASVEFTKINNGAPVPEINDARKTSNGSAKSPENAKQASVNSSNNIHASTRKEFISAGDLIGSYENRSESEFIFYLQLNKNGSVIYEEPDLEGGKSLKLRGRWKQKGDDLIMDFGKNGIYRYTIKPSLSWGDFGCKGASFGLENRSSPKLKRPDSSHNVWRRADMKAADKCQPA